MRIKQFEDKFTIVHFRKIPRKLYERMKTAAECEGMYLRDWAVEAWEERLQRDYPKWFRKRNKGGDTNA